ncbi:DUF3307 domain-containing protein [Rhizobium sp. TRM95111]|uniref:DUF3307 domain-containing protein n=1 Tax=Rhizobium alarense TaxID=2846851 RepID=UPI001F390C72|nr:DUF3307 domain-containing protein [Rhizobium alarense]MCF3640609.1 DUF3307 domain-containing protein [Rhizobium alarense]
MLWFAVVTAVFLLKHLLADFLLQTQWMAVGKDAERQWLPPLLAHVGIHAALTGLIALAVAPQALWLAAVDFVVHAAIDRSKSVTGRRLALAPKNPAFWWLLGLDQSLHHLTHLAFVLVLAGHA